MSAYPRAPTAGRPGVLRRADGQHTISTVRKAARERWDNLADGVSQLEHLHGGAIVTAVATLFLDYLALPAIASAALGLAGGILYRQVRFALEGGERKRCLDKVGDAATMLLDGELFSGRLSDMARMSGVTIRALARAVRQHRLLDALQWTGGADPLSGRIQDAANEFERATSHCASRLSPPRANTLVALVISGGAVASRSSVAYEAHESAELTGDRRYDPPKRREAMDEVASTLGAALIRLADSAEALEEIRDPTGFRVAEASRDAADATALGARLELQGIAAEAAEELLTTAMPAADDLQHSTLGKPKGTLREIRDAETFVLDGEDEEMALVRWHGRVQAAQQHSAPELADRGLEMHPRSHWMWLKVRNDSVQGLESAIQSLMSNVHAQRNSDGQFTEAIAENVRSSRKELRDAARRFVTCVEDLRRLEVR